MTFLRALSIIGRIVAPGDALRAHKRIRRNNSDPLCAPDDSYVHV